MEARCGLIARRSAVGRATKVAAVVPIAADILVPFVLVAGDARSGPYDAARIEDYLEQAQSVAP